MPTRPEDMSPTFSYPTIATDATSAPTSATKPTIDSPTPTILSAGRNGIVIMAMHPRLPNYPPHIYREGPIRSNSPTCRCLHLASPLAAEPSPISTYPIPPANHIRTMDLPENNPPPGWKGPVPYFYTDFSTSPVHRPLRERDIRRYTNPGPILGPRLAFSFGRREQRPLRRVPRPDPAVEILEGYEAENEAARTEFATMEDEDEQGTYMFHLNSGLLF